MSTEARTTNAERIKRYKRRMTAKQFKRLSIWVHPELLTLILNERRSNECYGRTLERLVLGEARDAASKTFSGSAPSQKNR